MRGCSGVGLPAPGTSQRYIGIPNCRVGMRRQREQKQQQHEGNTILQALQEGMDGRGFAFMTKQLEQEVDVSHNCCSDHLSCVCQVLVSLPGPSEKKERRERKNVALDHHSSLRSSRS